MKIDKLTIFYTFILLITPWILELLITKISFKDVKKFDPLEKSKKIESERYEKIKFFLNQKYFPPYTVNHGIENTNYFLELVDRYKFIPIGSFPNKKTYFCDEGYGFIKYKTDHLGLRNSSEDWNKKFPYDTLIIGDSFVNGACVDNGKEISSVLKEKGRQVINLGLGDNQPIQYFYLIEKFTKPKPPKNLVVVFYQGNDFSYSKFKDIYFKHIKSEGIEFSKEKKIHILNKAAKNFYKELKIYVDIESAQFLKNKLNVKIDHKENLINILKLNKIREILEFKYSIIIKRKLLCFKSYCLFGTIDELFSDTKLAIKSLIKNCNPTNNCNPIIALIPNSVFWKPGKIHETKKKQFDYIVNSFLNEYQLLNYYDSSQYIDNKDLSFYAPAGGHFSNKGYKVFSENLEKYLK